MRSFRPAYTLIELMIVVILVGLITALAIPQINQAARNVAMADAQNEIAVALRKARGLAARNGLSHRIHINAAAVPASQLVRIDEGEDNTCYNFVACNEAAPAYGGPKCGLSVVRMDNPFYVRNAVKMTALRVKVGGANLVATGGVLDLCITPMGRLYEITAGGICGNCVPRPTEAPLVLSLDRFATGYGGAPIGVRRCVIMPERGMPRSAHGRGCMP